MILHESNASVAASATTWSGTCYFAPFLISFVADSCWGNYKTIFISSIVYLSGMICLFLSASLPLLKPPPCDATHCPSATAIQKLAFFFGLYLVALGSGGVKASLLPFGADQFDDEHPKERQMKGIFFNWFYLCLSAGSLASSTLIVWIQENISWSAGFGISMSCLALATATFLVGTPTYASRPPRESPFIRVFRAMFASVKTRSSDSQVDELMVLLRLLPIWLSSIAYSISYAQTNATFIEQGRAMDTVIGGLSIPPATIAATEVISVALWVFVYDAAIVPLSKRCLNNGRGLSQLQRMGVGHALMVAAMSTAALVERARLARAQSGAHAMGVAWQVPQYFMIGASEVFAYVGQLEFFYEQAPETMKSTCTAVSLLTIAAGNYLSSLVVYAVEVATAKAGRPGWIPEDLNRGHLDYFFWVLAGVGGLNFVAYVVCARNYVINHR
ncbi:Peptide transporter PTR2 [Acorus calamus]|uniref:Peptide transporter PTR2 n=1 Tax=Acorus calamus TaxID=4465 RepID=A0AAV9DSS0_ACOCL|nr:Peptide transporter PTR2 [Acorus calamus]